MWLCGNGYTIQYNIQHTALVGFTVYIFCSKYTPCYFGQYNKKCVLVCADMPHWQDMNISTWRHLLYYQHNFYYTYTGLTVKTVATKIQLVAGKTLPGGTQYTWTILPSGGRSITLYNHEPNLPWLRDNQRTVAFEKTENKHNTRQILFWYYFILLQLPTLSRTDVSV